MEICLDEYSRLVTIKNCPKKELKPIYEDRKSYYGKAKIYDVKDSKVLVSYSTPIAVYKDGELFKLQSNDSYTLSWTTMRHLREFEKQMGCKVTYKTEWRNRAV